jgi:hypothetical protein
MPKGVKCIDPLHSERDSKGRCAECERSGTSAIEEDRRAVSIDRLPEWPETEEQEWGWTHGSAYIDPETGEDLSTLPVFMTRILTRVGSKPFQVVVTVSPEDIYRLTKLELYSLIKVRMENAHMALKDCIEHDQGESA